MYKENIFLKIITYAPLLFVPLLLGSVLFVFMQIYNKSFNESLIKAEENLYTIEKRAIENRVQNLSNLIIYKKSIIKNELLLRVKTRVEKALAQAKNIHQENKKVKSDREIKRMIKNALRPLTWNSGESFIWIVDFDGVFNLAPDYLKHLEGSSIIEFKDANNRSVVKEEISICQTEGEGFLWDTFTKPNDPTKAQYEQVAFVKPFGEYNWYFGSGEYLDTATKKTDAQLLKTIEKISDLDNQYTFLMNTEGTMLVNQTLSSQIGEKLSKTDNPSAKIIIKKILRLLQDKDSNSLKYKWINPQTNQVETKYTFVQKVPNTDWIIGSGVYSSYIENKLSKEQVNMYAIFYKESKKFIYLGVFLVLISFLTAYYISRKLKRSFIQYETDIDSKNRELIELNDSLELKVQTRTMELEKTKDKLEVLARTDSLTNINNRYSVMKLLEKEINRSHSYNTPLSLVLYDADLFKKVNDTYGHEVGDSVLVSLSGIVKKELRDLDIIGRYGGEEFLVVLPNTSLEEAKPFVDRIRKKVQEHHFEGAGSVTVSLGLAELLPDENISELFKRVDDLLYKSKNGGRNRVSF